MELDSRGRSDLSRACADRDIQLSSILSLLSNCRFGSDTSRDKNGKTALHIAIQSQCRLEIAEALCRFQRSQRSWGKSMAMTPDHLGDLPLHMACHNEYRHGVANMIKLFLELAPDAAKAENNQGKTPLYTALEHNASTEIIRMLVDACPESVSKDACDYYTPPLAVAIRNKAESDVFEMLVEADPSITQKRDGRGRYPLHLVLELQCSDLKIIKLLCSCPEAVSKGYSRGLNALSLSLTQSPVSPEIVEIILQTAPESVRATGGINRQTPLEVCYHRYTSTIRNITSRERHTGGDSNFKARRGVERWWKVLVMVLKLVTVAGEDDAEWSLLRAALSTDAPSSVIQTILERYPAQVHQHDANGRSPLHLSCMLGGRSWIERRQHKNKDAIVNLVLDAGVSAARRSDKDGRYALNLLTETGSVSPVVINKLIGANPEAVGELDRKYNLYPFLVVAAGDNRVDKHDKSIDRAAVSSIYVLLRERPDLLKSCV
jgi:ankyrin repeat protein